MSITSPTLFEIYIFLEKYVLLWDSDSKMSGALYSIIFGKRALFSNFMSVIVNQNTDPFIGELPEELNRIRPYTYLTSGTSFNIKMCKVWTKSKCFRLDFYKVNYFLWQFCDRGARSSEPIFSISLRKLSCTLTDIETDGHR